MVSSRVPAWVRLEPELPTSAKDRWRYRMEKEWWFIFMEKEWWWFIFKPARLFLIILLVVMIGMIATGSFEGLPRPV